MVASTSLLSIDFPCCRVLWLLSCWVSSIPGSLRPQLYGCLGFCLKHADKAVALTAARTLDNLVKDVGHEPSQLNDCFVAIVEGAFTAIATCEVTNAKLQLLELLAGTMQKVGLCGCRPVGAGHSHVDASRCVPDCLFLPMQALCATFFTSLLPFGSVFVTLLELLASFHRQASFTFQ